MFTKSVGLALALTYLATTVLFVPSAWADGRSRGKGGSKARVVRQLQNVPRLSSPRISSPRLGRLDGVRPQRGDRNNSSGGRNNWRRGEGLNRLGNLLDQRSEWPLLERLQDYDRRYNDRYDRYDDRYDGRYGSDKAYADAYRDAAIANAVVGIVGIIAQSGVYSQPAPRQGGYYERRQVVIREGYYEDYEVFVPQTYDPRTRVTIHEHYEKHRRWVPEVYGYQDVWVP